MRSHQGITLLESILFIAIAAVILTFAVRFAHTALLNSKEQQTIKLIEHLTDVSYQWLSMQQQAGFDCQQADDSSCTAIDNNVLHDAQLITNVTIQSPWGGEITTAPSHDSQYVTIQITQVPLAACNNLLAHLQPVAHDPNSLSCQNNLFRGDF